MTKLSLASGSKSDFNPSSPMTLTDSHCHLASQKFSPLTSSSDIIARARQRGVQRMVTLATCLDDCPQNISIAEQHPEVYACMGIHPCDVHETDDHYIHELTNSCRITRAVLLLVKQASTTTTLHQRDGRVINITAGNKSFLSSTLSWLLNSVKISSSIPVTAPARPHSTMPSASIASMPHQVRAVFHCFPFSLEAAQPILDLGGLISFTGIATFKNAGDCH